jgi:hypothetical protein
MPFTNVPPLSSPEFAQVRGELARAFIANKAALGPVAAHASDQAILDHVDDIMAVMMGRAAKAMELGDAAWLERYAWFTTLIETLSEGEPGKPLDG